jgi:hypothetical protein
MRPYIMTKFQGSRFEFIFTNLVRWGLAYIARHVTGTGAKA